LSYRSSGTLLTRRAMGLVRTYRRITVRPGAGATLSTWAGWALTMERLRPLKDGRLYMLLRTAWDRFWEAYSWDKGLSWRQIGPGPSTIPTSSSPGYMMRLASGRIALVWNSPPAGGKPRPLAEFFRATEKPLLAQCSPKHICSTGTLGDCPPYDAKKYKGYDALLDAMFQKHLDDQENIRENGMLNFGDWYHVDKFGGGWAKQEYDTSHCFFVQYLRSGDRRYFDRARQGAEHLMDVDVLHAVNRHIRGLDGHGQPQPGHIWTHSVGHTGGYYEDAALKAPIWYQRGLLQDDGHVWIGGLCDDYLLTGNRRALDVARLVADRLVSEHFDAWSDHIRGVG